MSLSVKPLFELNKKMVILPETDGRVAHNPMIKTALMATKDVAEDSGSGPD